MPLFNTGSICIYILYHIILRHVDAIILNRFSTIILYYNKILRRYAEARVYPHHGMLDRRIDVHFQRFPKLTYNEERVALLKTPLLQVHNIILLYMRRDAKRIVRIFVRSCILYIYICYIVYIGAPDSRCCAIIIYFVFRFFFCLRSGRA